MKKILLGLGLMVAGLCAQAQQVYVGGSLGLDVVSTHIDQGGTATQTTFEVVPEIGCRFNKTWSVGISMGYGLSKQDDIELQTFSFTPYVRAVFARAGIVDFFGELTAGYSHLSVEGEGVSGMLVAMRPGMAINFSERFALVARTNLLEYDYWDGTGVTDFSLNKGFNVGVQFTF